MNSRTLVILTVALGLGLGAGHLLEAQQAPAPPAAGVPDWVVKYAQGEEKAARDCRIELAQAGDLADKLKKQLTDAQAALAKASPAPAAAEAPKK